VKSFNLPESCFSRKLMVSPDNQKIAVLTSLGNIVFMETSSTSVLFTVKNLCEIISFDIDKRWKHLATVQTDGSFQLYDLEFVANYNSRVKSVESVTSSSGPKSPRDSQYSQNLTSQIPITMKKERTKGKKEQKELSDNIILPRSDGAEVEYISMESPKIPLNMQKLRKTLHHYGKYPDKYRTLIWRYILRLPENKEAFDILYSRPIHFSLHNLHKRYPIADSSLFRRLEK
jgi:hypothetical protein